VNQRYWNIYPPISAEHTLRKYYPPLLAQLLHNRGITDLAQAEAFIGLSSSGTYDPWNMNGIAKAVQRIQQALLRGELIAVYGDFDVDGISATVLLTKGIERLGGKVLPYIPHRFLEGHGLNHTAVNMLALSGVSLIISADCGINGIEEGECPTKPYHPQPDLIITDHHFPPSVLPKAHAMVNPKLHDSNYPHKDLSGVGVAYKLLQALYNGLGRENELDQYLEMVALGTVADMMPLVGENRYLVKSGIQHLRDTKNIGLAELASLSSIDLKKLDAQNISFGLAPRLNAAGRISHANSAFELLTTTSSERARTLAQEIIEQNGERQRLTSSALAHAKEQIMSEGERAVLFAHDSNYSRGIIGLVAGKLCDEHNIPAVVVQTNDDICYGSARSIPEFNITEAIANCSDLLTRYGGHDQAAGFSLPTKNLFVFRNRLEHIALGKLEKLARRQQLDIDMVVPLSKMNHEVHSKMERLAPFGIGNQTPVFLSRGVQITDCRSMGINGSHLRLKLKQGAYYWDAVAFGMGERIDEVHALMDIVYNLELNEWNGESKLRINLLDFARDNSHEQNGE